MKLNLKKLAEPKTATTITLYASTMGELRDVADTTGWAMQKILASAVNTFIDTYVAEQAALAKDTDSQDVLIFPPLLGVVCTCHADKVCGYCQLQRGM